MEMMNLQDGPNQMVLQLKKSKKNPESIQTIKINNHIVIWLCSY